ncbi:MAG TPA: YciI family protein [Solirubrobacteraceae bacterium]|jgi:hypothetical protein
MKYMLLLYSAPGSGPRPESPEGEAQMGRWFAVTDEMEKAGVLVAGDALQPTDTATTVRVRDGDTVLTDGPFAETKETLGGYYLIDVPDLDAAAEWAAKMPLAPYGSVEIRALLEFDRS